MGGETPAGVARVKRPVVCSFWVHRPKDYPDAPDYVAMLKILDESCKRFDLAHVVLTDLVSAPQVARAGMLPYAVDLPANLMRALTEVQARWLESPHSRALDTVFVGADCIIRRDFVGVLPPADLSIVYMPDHKKWRMMNGFMMVPAVSREVATPVFRLIADDTSDAMCDDMAAIERALSPMPPGYGIHERRGLRVNFLEESIWNGRPMLPTEGFADSYVLHFRGAGRKPVFFEWAKANGFG